MTSEKVGPISNIAGARGNSRRGLLWGNLGIFYAIIVLGARAIHAIMQSSSWAIDGLSYLAIKKCH